ncbi:MAG: hypothetical protein KKB50_09260 [Planctomycetes bacterium]|nr:hypothetical protein [Planctomycetota bacterium]
MAKRSILVIAGLLIVAGLVTFAGCGKDNRVAETVDQKQLAGTWLEIPPEPVDPKKPGQGRRTIQYDRPTPKLRQLTFNDDGTFKLVLCEPGGGAADEKSYAEGTWKYSAEEGWVTFAITKNTFAKKLQKWIVPEDLDMTTGPDGKVTCYVNFEEGSGARCERKQ